MLPLAPDERETRGLRILCLGCHSDDIEIGCGGSILRLAAEWPNCVFYWVVMSALGVRETEAQCAASRFVDPSRLKLTLLKTFPDGFMPFIGRDIKMFFEEIKREIVPDVIFTHTRTDAHQDHRLIADLTWNTFRNHLILEYEIPKYDGDMGRPAVFIPLPTAICERKIDIILDTFQSQRDKQWFSQETFRSIMRLRGIECNSASGYAEAFYARKIVI